MRRSKVEIYLHVVWGTWERQPLVTAEMERDLYRCIESEVKRLEGKVHAIGGMPDHVHLVVWIPTTLTVAKLVKQVKGVSSTFVRDQLRPDTLFKWQEGYGVFSVTPSHLDKVIAYVENQKTHHAVGTTANRWEETDEAVDDSVQSI
jgi:REP element-mobilizing transposase RayT